MASSIIPSFFGAKSQADAARDAGQMQYNAAMQSMALQKQMYDQQRTDQEPWRQSGITALGKMSDPDFQRDFTAADFQKDPGYDFRMQEGQKALERSAAASGGLQSGGTLQALAKYGQDYASNEYQNAYNRFNNDRTNRFDRLSALAGIGQTANGQLAQAGSNYANQAGEAQMGAGNAQAAGRLGQGQAWAGMWGNINKSMQDDKKMALSGLGAMGGL